MNLRDILKSELVRQLASGALAGAAEASGVVPGIGHRMVARTLRRVARNATAIEFVSRAIYMGERTRTKGHRAWEELAAGEQAAWRARARDAFAALMALSEHAAANALDTALSPEQLVQRTVRIVGEAVKRHTARKPVG